MPVVKVPAELAVDLWSVLSSSCRLRNWLNLHSA
jgi:hypothetical protein